MADRLKTAKGKLYAHKCDLTKEDQILDMFSWIKKTLGGVDICVNNAGLGDYSTLLGTSLPSVYFYFFKLSKGKFDFYPQRERRSSGATCWTST